MTPTSPPAEARLIARRRNEPPKMSVRQAAARAGISETRWRQIEQGTIRERGREYAVTAPDATLAAMARAIGVTPAELDDADRRDAAAELRAMLRTGPPGRLSTNERLSHIERLLAEIRSEINDEEERPKGGSVSESSPPARARPA